MAAPSGGPRGVPSENRVKYVESTSFFESLVPIEPSEQGPRVPGRVQGPRPRRVCEIRVVETITVAGGKPNRFLYNSPDGIVVEKKFFDFVAVLTSWRQAATANPALPPGNVMLVRRFEGTLEVLDVEQFDAFMRRLDAEMKSVVALQRFMHSRGGDRSIYRVAYVHTPGSRATIESITRQAEFLSPERHLGRSESVPVNSFNDVVNHLLESFVRRSVAHAEKRIIGDFTKGAFDFILDDREHAYLLWVSDAFITDTIPGLTKAAAGTVAGDGGVEWSAASLEGGVDRSASKIHEEYGKLVGNTVGDGSRGKVLVVEADPVTGVAAARALVGEGFAVACADDGPRALSMTRTTAFDCMLLSRDLPTLSGLEVTRVVRQREANAAAAAASAAAAAGEPPPPPARMAIIVFTDKTSEDDLRLYRDSGMNGCVSKPLLLDALVRTIAAAVPVPSGAIGRAAATTAASSTAAGGGALVPAGGAGRGRASSSVGEGLGSPGPRGSPALRPLTPSQLPPLSRSGGGGLLPPASPMGEMALDFSGGGGGKGRASTGGAGGIKSPYAENLVNRLEPAAGPGGSMRARSPTGHGGGGGGPEALELGAPAGGGSGMPASPGVALAPRPVTGGIHGGRVTTGGGLPIPGTLPPSRAPPVAAEDGSVTGTFQFDAETAVPYCVMGKDDPKATIKPPRFHLVLINDIFDTYETYQIFFRRMVQRQPGLKVLLFNYPGQAYTTYRKDAILNNEYIAGVLQALMAHLGPYGNKAFDLDEGTAPFYLGGYGQGAAAAQCFAWKYGDNHPNMRALVLVNSFSHVDSHLAGVYHDCVNVFSCTPPSRPDLPVYFYARFLFSAGYLERVGAPLALNMYTAVTNPITLEGRIALCQGALSNINTFAVLSSLPLPVIMVVGMRDPMVKATHTAAVVKARGGEARSIKRQLNMRRGVALIQLQAGHEVWQECRTTLMTLFVQLTSGYHERNDVAFQPVEDVDHEPPTPIPGIGSKPEGIVDASRAAKLTQFAGTAAAEQAKRSVPWGKRAGHNLDPSLLVGAPSNPMLEDRFLDHVVTSMRDPSLLARYPSDVVDLPGPLAPSYGGGAGSPSGAPGSTSLATQVIRENTRKSYNDTLKTAVTTPGAALPAPEPYPGAGIPSSGAGLQESLPPKHRAIMTTTTMVPVNYVNQQMGTLPPLQRLNKDDATMITAKLARASAGVPLNMSRRGALSAPHPDVPIPFGAKSMGYAEGTPLSLRASNKAIGAGAGMSALGQDPGNASMLAELQEQAEVKEYMRWRVKRNQRRLRRLEAASVIIQRAYRAYVARTAVRRIKEHRAALEIQRWWRGELARAFVGELLRFHRAARNIQRLYRGYKARLRVRRIYAESQAAVAIQRIYRGWIARKFVIELRIRLNEAAIVIQSAWRRFMAIRELIRRRIERVAAITIQRLVRGFLARKKAARERERYLFSKSQAQGIEFGRQLLMEHKMQATRLQSEVSMLTREKVQTEEGIQALLAEIASFEQGVRQLEKEMLQLARADAEIAMSLDDNAKAELREHKLRLDREFGNMLAKISDRREQLSLLEGKLTSLDRSRAAKREELKDLERKLVVLLEQQQAELSAIRQRQEVRGERLIEDAVAAVQRTMTGGQPLLTDGAYAGGPQPVVGQAALALADAPRGGGGGGSGIPYMDPVPPALERRGAGGGAVVPAGPAAAGGGGGDGLGGGPTAQQRAEAAALMASTETMMKFGFMAMSLTYFSSLNMVRGMRQLGTANTVVANNPVLSLISQVGAAAMSGASPAAAGALLASGAGETTDALVVGGKFKPAVRAGQLPGQESVDPRLWSQADVSAWLDALQLSQYKDAFADAAIDGPFLFELTEDDLLNSLGIEHALHRKKIIAGIIKLTQQRAELERREAASQDLAASAAAAAAATVPGAVLGPGGQFVMPGASGASMMGGSGMMPGMMSGMMMPGMMASSGASMVGGSGMMPGMMGMDPSASMGMGMMGGGGTGSVGSATRPASRGSAAPRGGGGLSAPAAVDPGAGASPLRLHTAAIEAAENTTLAKQQQREGGLLKLDELMSWVRHNKGKQLAEALAVLSDTRFDPATVKNAYVPGFGTEYADFLAGPAFHINKADENGNTLLVVACQNGRMKMAQLLIKKGANPDHQNSQGNTGMHYAMAYKFVDLAAWLVDPEQGGASDELVNAAGLGVYDGLE